MTVCGAAIHKMPCDVCYFDFHRSFVSNNKENLLFYETHIEEFEVSGIVRIDLDTCSGNSIIETIAQGCWICRMIRDSLRAFDLSVSFERDVNRRQVKKINLQLCSDSASGVLITTFLGNSDTVPNGQFCIVGNSIPWPTETEPPPPSRFEYLSNLTVDSRLGKARAWLDKCTLEHSECQQSVCSPKRLLSIQNEHGTLSVRLCTPGHSVERYACLSYCWGRTGNLKTLVDNIEQHVQGIPLTSLPKTIQDAVQICWALQIPHLWVDALCIVQDDENDWASECARMGDIYAGAHVTLAAVRGSDSKAGLIHDKLFQTARINVWPPTGSPTEALVYRPPQHSYPSRGHHREHLRRRPLFTRGWVYQELLLSPRILRFDGDELSFECRKGMMCECGEPPDEVDEEETEGTDPLGTARWEFKKTFVIRRRHFSPLESGTLSNSDAFSLWYDMVTQYSSMELTKQNDRLPAFSAIASRFSKYGGRYYAGIWENDLVTGLKWFRSSEGVSNIIPSTRCGPSWSWASRPDSISYRSATGGTLYYSAKVSIRDLVLSNDSNIFGGVSEGRLDAIGFLKPAKLEYRGGRYTLIGPNDQFSPKWYSVKFQFDGRLPHEFEAKLLSTQNSVCCFLLGKNHRDNRGLYPTHTAVSLILGLIDEQQCMYQRIGFMYEAYSEESWLHDAKEAKIIIQ